MSEVKCKLFNDHFQNHKRYQIRKAQLIIADIPYNLGNNAYASNPQWYNEGDNKKGESKFANAQFFDTDINFNINEFFAFVGRMLKPEPKETGEAPALIVMCAFNQIAPLIEVAKKHGFKTLNHPIIFIKNYSAEVLKANMRLVGATEYAVLFYRDKLPKYRNNGKMQFNWFEYEKDFQTKKIHPTQKPLSILKRLIELFTDEGDTVIDPVAGSGSTLLASKLLGRHSFGFEIKKDFYKEALDFINEREVIETKEHKSLEQLSIFNVNE